MIAIRREDARRVLGAEAALSARMEQAVGLWGALYTGQSGQPEDTLQLPAAVASEFARLTLDGMESRIYGSRRAECLNRAYQQLLGGLRQNLEYGCAKGGLLFKPYPGPEGVEVDVLQPDWVLPTDFDSRGEMTGAVFAERRLVGKRYATRLEWHRFENGRYTIRNRAFLSGAAGEFQRAVPLAKTGLWSGMEEEVTLANVRRPLFSYFRTPQANTVDPCSPLGVSVYARAAGLLRQADRQYRICVGAEEGTADWGRLTELLQYAEAVCALDRGALSGVQAEAAERPLLAARRREAVQGLRRNLRAALMALAYGMDVWADVAELTPPGKYVVEVVFPAQ